MLSALLGLHVATAAVAVCAGRRLGRRVWLVSGLAPLAVIVWLASNATVVGDGGALGAAAAWVPALGLTFDLRLDAFSALMVVLVSGIGVLVNVYAWRYFGDSDDTPRAAGLLTLFAGSMFGVVVADNLLALFVFWELTSVTSYLLIGLHDADRSARAAAQRALLTTGLGGLAMLGGFVLLGQQAGTFRLSEILTVAPSGTVTVVALVLVLAGAFTKSAQYPFHFWLPGAMVAPTPISAYLHSAAMVKAGVYLVARFAPAFAAVGPWRPLVVGVGLVTMVAGGLRALRPFDLKQLLAFGTISQLGFLMVMFGIGKPGATAAGCALLLAHSLFKAALFMVVGIVDHETHTRDLREMPVLGPGWATIRTVAAVSAASMAAVPPLAGFVAKEQAYTALVDGSTVDRFVLVGLVAGSILTVAYSIRFAIALLRPGLLHREDRPRRVAPAGPSGWFIAPAALLTAGSVILGIAPGSWSGFVEQAAQALDAAANIRLELWHGLSVPFVLSVCTLVSGVGLFALGRQASRALEQLRPPISGESAYDALQRGLIAFASKLTGIVQPGSLPVYTAVILSTAALLPTAALVLGAGLSGGGHLAVGHPAVFPIVAVLVIGAVAATVARRRFAAVVVLGLVGYAMSMLFVFYGAPDLALTQFGVETLFVVVFLLVLRQLPAEFERRDSRAGRLWRLAVAGTVGLFVVVMGVVAAASRMSEPVSGSMAERAYDEGFGSNVVNVILVDIRGLDTIGEVTVLVAAALGIVALGRVGRRPRPRPRRRARRETRASDPIGGDVQG